jgi:GAF domain-containing protein/HAMP domain-containing protein
MMSVQKEKPERRASARSLAATLVTAFLVLMLIALSIAYVPQLFFFVQVGNRAIDSEQQLIASEAASTVVNFIQVKFDVLEAAARFGNPTVASLQDQERILASLMGLQPAFQQLAFLDAQGQELSLISHLSQAASGHLVDRAGSGWLDQVRQGIRYISPVYVDEATSEPLVIMAVPSLDVFGDFQGVLLAEVNLKFMWDLVGRLDVGETGLAYVVDRQGNLLAFGDVGRVLRGENVSQLDLVARFIEGSAPAGMGVMGGFRGINGTRVVGTYVSLGVPDWAVVTELPIVEGIGPYIRSLLISLGVMVIIALSVAGAAIYISRRLAAPLLNLTATASRIAGGETDLQAAPQGPAEVVDLAEAFNSMTAQLHELLTNLEQRVAERTRGLLTAAEVAKTTTAVLDINELLPQVVNLMQDRFALYYVGLFLVDEAGEYAILRAGSGQAGQQMLAQGWRLPVGGNSMIGRCVSSGQADIQLDVGEAAVRFSNPFLPDTRSELALPLRAGEQVLGAMTVQSDQEAFFSQEDITVMQTVVDQVTNAVRNAGLFQQLQENVDAERRAYGELTRDAWLTILQSQSDLGFVSDRRTTVQNVDVWRSEMEVALSSGRIEQGQGDTPTLAIPIKVRDQVVGVVDGRKPDGTAWSEEEVDLLQALTEQLSTALESAQLYRESQRAAARERTISEVTGRIRESLDIETVLKTTASEIRQALDLDTLVIRLAAPETGDTSVPA